MDLATLGMRFETTGAEFSVQKMDQVATAAGKVERATDGLAAGNKRAGSATQQMLASIERNIAALVEIQKAQQHFIIGLAEGAAAAVRESRAIDEASTATARMAAETQKASNVINLAQARTARAHAQGAAGARLQSYEMLNLSRQFADIGTMLASGQNPFLLIAQQGPQVGEILGIAAARGVTFRVALGQVLGMLGGVAAAAAPFAVAIGAAAGAFAMFHRELSKDYPKDITAGLGLTEEQLKRVEHRTVTMGDTFRATLNVVGKHLMDGPIGEGLRWLGDAWTKWLDQLGRNTASEIANIVGFFTGSYDAIRATWRMLPAAMGDIAISSANAVLRAIEGMINASVEGMNKLIGLANSAADKVGLPQNMRLGALGSVNLGQIANPFEGQAAAAGEALAKAYIGGAERGVVGTLAVIDRTLGRIETEAERVARVRALEEAGAAKSIKDKEAEAKATQWLTETLRELAEIKKAGAAAAKATPDRVDVAAAEAAHVEALREAANKREIAQERYAVEILRQQMDLAKSYSERLDLSGKIAGHEYRIAILSAQVPKALEKISDVDRLMAGYDDLYGSLTGASRAFEAGDFGSAVRSLMDAFRTLKDASVSTGGKIAALANMAGQMIGGVAGSTISGAAQGFAQGGIFGAFIGGIAGLISGNKKKAEERARQQEAEAQRLAQLADQRRQMEIALLQAGGDAIGALAAQRAYELSQIDASLRPLQEQIYAAQDAAEAAAKAAQAMQDAADAARELAEKTADLARQHRSLELQLLEAQGRALEAVTQRRQDELAALDESLRALQQFVWYAQDLATASAALTAANDNLANAEQSLIGLQQQAAMRAEQAIVDQLRAVSDAAQQTLSDVSAAATQAAQRVQDARSILAAAYEKEAGALQATIDKFRGFSEALRAFREGLGQDGAGGLSYSAARAAFRSTAGLAAAGDPTALGGLQSSAQTFLGASANNARTLLDHQRDLAIVRAAVRAAEGAAEGKAGSAQQQLDALNRSVDGLLQVNQSVISVRDAIAGLSAAQAGQASAQLSVDVAQAAALTALAHAQAAQASLVASQAAQQAAAQQAALAAAQAALATAQQQQVQAQQNVETTNAARPPGYQNWDSYLTHYTDVAAAYSYDPNGQASGRTAQEWAKLHWDVSGRLEGRTPYALGGIFTNGVVTEPTSFHNSMMGEAGPEAIMPLDRGPDGRLGVRAVAANDSGETDDLLRAILAKLDRIDAAAVQTAGNTGKGARTGERLTDMFERLTDGGEAMQTVAA